MKVEPAPEAAEGKTGEEEEEEEEEPIAVEKKKARLAADYPALDPTDPHFAVQLNEEGQVPYSITLPHFQISPTLNSTGRRPVR